MRLDLRLLVVRGVAAARVLVALVDDLAVGVAEGADGRDVDDLRRPWPRARRRSTVSVPTTFASYIARCSDLGMPTSYTAAPWMTASQPSMRGADRVGVGERARDRARSRASSRAAPFSGVRTSARTSSPRSRSLRTTWPPMNPVPPVTKTFIAPSLYPPRYRVCRRSLAERAYTGTSGRNRRPGDRERERRQRDPEPAGPSARAVRGRPVRLARRRRSPRGAQGAPAHRRSRERRRGRPDSLPAGSRSLSRPREALRGQGRDLPFEREPRRVRRRAGSAPGAQPRAGSGRAGDRPDRGDPRHLRRPRPQRRGQAPGGAGPARVQPRADARPVDPPRAARWRDRHQGPGRVADRDRPPPRRATASRTCGAAWSAWSETARSCAPAAAARRSRSSRSPGTRTPASRRCSTR